MTPSRSAQNPSRSAGAAPIATSAAPRSTADLTAPRNASGRAGWGPSTMIAPLSPRPGRPTAPGEGGGPGRLWPIDDDRVALADLGRGLTHAREVKLAQ